MPHLTLEYTTNLEAEGRIDLLCQALAATMAELRHDDGKPVFPLAGTRVLAYPAAAHAVGGQHEGRGFVYARLRITPGRDAETLKRSGDAILKSVSDHFASVNVSFPYAVTFHMDEVTPAYEGRYLAH